MNQLPTTMTAIEIDGFGGPDVLKDGKDGFIVPIRVSFKRKKKHWQPSLPHCASTLDIF